MSLSDCSPTYHQLKTDIVTTREQLLATLDRYAKLCLTVRSTHHQTSFKDSQLIGLPCSDIASELLFLPLLETRLQEATYNLNRAYEMEKVKSSPGYPHPIHKLPDELLAQIFRYAGATRPRNLHRDTTNEPSANSLPQYPDFIAQTCARWRQVALACSSLWTCIHLIPHPTDFGLVLDHARLYVERAVPQLLELCITDIQDGQDPDVDLKAEGLEQFVLSIAARTRSLEIVRSGILISDFERESLVGILRGCSKVFTMLFVHSKGLYRPGFIKPLDDDNKDWDMELGLSPEEIEHGLAHLTVLHASQICPMWGSAAYQGLVDLRLVSNHEHIHDCPVIKTPEFIAILQASPRLRILHFGLDLRPSHDLPADSTNVQLNDLEVLYLSASESHSPAITEYEMQCIMRHIIPGKKPLCLTIDRVHYKDRCPLEGMKAFFRRSHIVKFCARRGTPPPVELLNHAPHLTHIVFDGCQYNGSYNLAQNPCEINLESLIIRGPSNSITEIEPLLEHYVTESCVISDCRFLEEDDDPLEISVRELEDWTRRLPDYIRYVRSDPWDPTASWNDLE